MPIQSLGCFVPTGVVNDEQSAFEVHNGYLLEHGRLEVNDSSVKWISPDGLLADSSGYVSAILLGPGTPITHAAVKACRLEHPALLDRRRRNALLRHRHYVDT